MAELPKNESYCRVKVVGVGSAGCNTIERLIEEKINGIEFVAIHNDAQLLTRSKAESKVFIGKPQNASSINSGQETGGPFSEESMNEIANIIKNSDMVIITAEMGSRMVTETTPVIAKIAKEAGALTVAIVTTPFSIESQRKYKIAEKGIRNLKKYIDTLIVIPNDRLAQLGEQISAAEALRLPDQVLFQYIKGISEIITVPGLINLDFGDVRHLMARGEAAYIGVGQAGGEDKVRIATEMAMSNPLLEITIGGARSVLFNVTGGPEVSLYVVNSVAEIIRRNAHPSAEFLLGVIIDPEMGDEIRVTIVATGFDNYIRPDIHSSSRQSIGDQKSRTSQPSASESGLVTLTFNLGEPLTPPIIRDVIAPDLCALSDLQLIINDLQQQARPMPRLHSISSEKLSLVDSELISLDKRARH